MARRGRGEGTIYQRKDGRWASQLIVGYNPETGKPKRLTLYGKTQREVQDKLQKAKEQQAKGLPLQPNKVTLGEWLDRWLNDYMKPHLRQSTFEDYEIICRVHLKPALGKRRLRNLWTADIQQLYRQKLESGLSPRRVQLIHIVLKAALAQAVKEGLLPANPVAATKPPKPEPKEAAYLSPDQLEKFLKAASQSELYPAYLTMVGAGLRCGETLGLKWEDIDLEAGTLRVTRSLVWTKRGLRFEPPKTKKGARLIPLPQEVVQALKQHRIRQNEVRLALGAAWQDNGLVFPGPFGKPRNPRAFRSHFKRLLKKAGLPDMRLHDLRHTHASLLLLAREHPKVVQERLGHSAISITMDTYSHVMPSLQEEAATKIDAILKATKPQENQKKAR